MSRSDSIQSIPLDRLVISSANVRKTPPGAAEQAELKASIAAHGLQQNLVVRRAPRRKGVFEVIAGGRRLDALKALQAEGAVPADYAVPCKVRTKNVEEISLAENTIRARMHPADEFEAFARLVDKGDMPAGIAQRFGTTEKHVRQRLKLGKVAPQILQAYRNGEMDLEILMAFTLSEDHKAQRAAWNQVKGDYHVSPHSVRRLLTEKSIPANSRLGRFVGAEDYEAAGGHVTRDLFSERDDGYLSDAKLVRKLALDKLEAKAKELESEWRWAKTMVDPDYGFTAEFGRVYPQPANVPDEITRKIERIDARLEQIDEVDEEGWTEAIEAEAEQLTGRREELEAVVQQHTDFTPEDKARAGCIVTIGHDGEVQVHAGLIAREELETQVQNGAAGSHQADALSGGPDTPDVPLSPEQTVRKENGFSQGVIDDLKAHRLQITKAHLAGDFETAFDVALYSLCIDILQVGYRSDPLDLRAVQTRVHSSLNDLKETPADRMLSARREALSASWLSLPPADGFAALCALSTEDKQALFAWCIAQSLNGQLTFEDDADPVIEQVGERLGINFAAHWRPMADNYWSRVKKDHALEVGGQILGPSWRRDHAKLKKPQIAEALETAFSGDETVNSMLDAAARDKAAKWLPPGMVYGADAEGQPDVANREHTEAGADGAAAAGSESEGSEAVVLPEFLTDSGAKAEPDAVSQS